MPAYSRDAEHTCIIRSGGMYLECLRFGWWVIEPKNAFYYTRDEAEEIVRTSGVGWEVEETGG